VGLNLHRRLHPRQAALAAPIREAQGPHSGHLGLLCVPGVSRSSISSPSGVVVADGSTQRHQNEGDDDADGGDHEICREAKAHEACARCCELLQDC